MIRLLPALSLLVLPSLTTGPTWAASFDCSKASTPFEKAICDNPEISTADERLAKAYAFSLAGLSPDVEAAVKKSQQDWLNYAQRACSADNKNVANGTFDERMVWCLNQIYSSRLRALEMSRIVNGHRLYPVSTYASYIDSYIEEEPDFRWPVGQHELTIVQFDSDAEFVPGLNKALMDLGEELSTVGETDLEGDDAPGGEDATVTIGLQQLHWNDRISFEVSSQWYPHGAAHGGYSTSYRHYLPSEGRFLSADDVFEGKNWTLDLAKITAAALEAQLSDILFPDSSTSEGLEDIVGDVERWNLSNELGLQIQFQPYEVAAYAYGAPTVFLLWEDLAPLLKEGNPIH